MTLAPIETRYKGYRFRSRLEARWAVFFDALGIRWEYEKQGFDLGDGYTYLPDFWLPTIRVWFEVKGAILTREDREKVARLRCYSYPVVVACGNIGEESLTTFGTDLKDSSGGSSEWEDCDWCLCEEHNQWTIDFGLTNSRLFFGHANFEDSAGCCYWPVYKSGTWAAVADAYAAARGARFEHGESPR